MDEVLASTKWSVFLAVFLVCVFCAIYGPRVGHGFIKDDFNWIATSTARGSADVSRLLWTSPTGFYRPIVSLSFTANRAVCGLNAKCYGLSNLVLALLCASAIYGLTVALTARPLAGVIAGGGWLYNWHGISMALLWISGRTALLLTLFAALAATLFLRRRLWLALTACALAMLSKEEAIDRKSVV